MIAASPMTSNSATGCTACHTCPRCSDEQWAWVPITGICAERLDIHLGSRMSSTLRIDELRTPRHPRWGVCYSGVCHVTAPMTALSKYADIRGPDAFNPHPRRGGVSRRHHRSPAVAMKPAGRDPRRPNGLQRCCNTDALFLPERQSFLEYPVIEVGRRQAAGAVHARTSGEAYRAPFPGASPSASKTRLQSLTRNGRKPALTLARPKRWLTCITSSSPEWRS